MRKAQLVDIVSRQGGDDVAGGSVNDGDVLGRGPGEEATVRRVDTASKVPLGSLEARKILVQRCSIKNTNVLGCAIYGASMPTIKYRVK